MRANHAGKGGLGTLFMFIVAGGFVLLVISGMRAWRQRHMDVDTNMPGLEAALS